MGMSIHGWGVPTTSEKLSNHKNDSREIVG